MANAPRRHAKPRIETIGGEEFVDAEAPRQVARQAAPQGNSPPTQAERLEALKALQVARKHVQAIFDKLGGKEGSRPLAIARQRLEEAVLWANHHIVTTQKAWR
jgi:hypothetical protein